MSNSRNHQRSDGGSVLYLDPYLPLVLLSPTSLAPPPPLPSTSLFPRPTRTSTFPPRPSLHSTFLLLYISSSYRPISSSSSPSYLLVLLPSYFPAPRSSLFYLSTFSLSSPFYLPTSSSFSSSYLSISSSSSTSFPNTHSSLPLLPLPPSLSFAASCFAFLVLPRLSPRKSMHNVRLGFRPFP